MNKSNNLDTVNKTQTTKADARRRRNLESSVPGQAMEFTLKHFTVGLEPGGFALEDTRPEEIPPVSAKRR